MYETKNFLIFGIPIKIYLHFSISMPADNFKNKEQQYEVYSKKHF